MTRGKPNRLIHEKSPYLLQHAYNPVDWYPWGEEAFSRATAEDKPVFLSIGYSTCHWCHVMARESFEDPQVAALMNSSFVNIKLDREERPEIDHIYMAVALELMGTGGWPLTIVMTPEQKPFFAATYIPRGSGFGLVGMLDLIPMIDTAWKERREELLTAADKVTVLLRMPSADKGGGSAQEVVARTLGDLRSNFDPEYGGFGGPPKFPTPHTLIFLLRAFQSTGDQDLLSMAEKTLLAMHAGGIYDHAGFGFHRYAMDASWLVPHFEKMLYDQALIAMAYIEAFRVTGQARYRAIAREIFTYMIRDLRGNEGAFSSAEDAESGGKEGGFYLWTRDEIGKVLSGNELVAFTGYYGICRDGNIPRHTGAKSSGDNILYNAKTEERVAADLGILPGDLGNILASAIEKVRAARGDRPRPARDEKILTDWNGLALAALAMGARTFGSGEYMEAGKRAATFILSTMVTKEGRLLHRYRSGEAAVDGNADDYTHLTWGLLELYHSTLDISFLERAVAITDIFVDHFWDGERGGFFFTPDDGEPLIARLKPVHDGATPSANSVALSNLLTITRLTGRTRYLDIARDLVSWYLREHAGSAAASTWMMASLNRALNPSVEVVVVGDPEAADTRALLQVVNSHDRPEMVILLKPATGDPILDHLAPFTRGFTAKSGKASAYVCRNHACELPVTDPESLKGILDSSPAQQVQG
ncbi:MAG: thioredoxin domain-containing protein [Methanomicrobiales archaeon]|jgi:uncharacterized protein YyaL (SSP411 family)